MTINMDGKDFEQQMNEGWQSHECQPQAVFDHFCGSLGELQETQFESAIQLVSHIAIGHLQQPERLIEVLSTLAPHCQIYLSFVRAQCVARYFVTQSLDGLAVLPEQEQRRIQAQIANEWAGLENADQASRFLAQACEGLLPDDSSHPLARALAITGNNLACLYEGMEGRTEQQAVKMVAAAEVGLQFWRRAGTWLQEERAEYRLAMSHLKAGQPEQARVHALRCETLCRENQADAFELYFANDLLMLVHYHIAQAHKAQVPEKWQTYCKTSALTE